MDVDAFVEAIIKQPHEMDARRVFADYLDEIGDPRAELIRLQFELNPLSRFDPARRRLRSRELELVREHGCFGSVPSIAKVIGTEGGFIDAIELTAARFLKHQNEIFASSPIRKVVLVGKSKRIGKLAESPHLSQLTSLTLKNNDERREVLAQILTQGGWQHIEELDLRGDWVDDHAASTIADSEKFATLKSVSLSAWNYSANRAISRLADSRFVNQLEKLEFNGVDDKSCRQVATSANFRNLKSIELEGQGISVEGMRQLHTSKNYPGLDSLRISNQRYHYYRGDEDITEGSPFDVETGVNGITQLEVFGGFRDVIVDGIIRNFPDLEVLRLSENIISNQGAMTLANSGLFSQLRALYLTHNRIGVEGLTAIGKAREENRGLKVYLDGNNVSRKQINELRDRFGKTFLTATPY